MTREYIPETRFVREMFAMHSNPFERAQSAEEFDRWLASVKAEAWREGFQKARASNVHVPNPYRKERR